MDAFSGARRIRVGSSLARLAYTALIEAAREMRSEGRFTFGGRAIGFAEIEGLLKSVSKDL